MRAIAGSSILIYASMIWFFGALVRLNEGTLFRLRLLGILPLAVLAAAGGGLDAYAAALRRLANRRSRSAP